MIRGSIQQEAITLKNIYAPNTGSLKYTEQILMDIKGEIDSNTVSHTREHWHPTDING